MHPLPPAAQRHRLSRRNPGTNYRQHTPAQIGTTTPLVFCLATLSVLRSVSERALVLHTPQMMWLLFMSQPKSETPWYVVLLAHLSVLGILIGCWRGKRSVARWSVLCCTAAAVWLQWGRV